MGTGTILSLLTWLAVAEGSNLVARQESLTEGTNGQRLCEWYRPQTALIRDQIYLDSGDLSIRSIVNGGLSPSDIILPEQNLYHIDLKQPFKLTTSVPLLNISTVIHEQRKASVNEAPLTRAGHMLHNEYGFISFGGTIEKTSQLTQIPALNWANAYDIYPQPPRSLGRETWRAVTLGGGVTRGLVQGAAASAPSENRAWVFGGSVNKDGNDIQYLSTNASHVAATKNTNLISADLSNMRDEKWTKAKIPNDIDSRSLAEMVWLPVSDQGALVIIGGTSMTYNQSEGHTDFSEDQVDDWTTEGEKFMKEITLYDPASNKWYTQETTGDIPPPTADFCAVASTSDNGESHQILIYGGHDGLRRSGLGMVSAVKDFTNPAETFDTAYVLSIPSFIWTQVRKPAGELGMGRRGHRCHKVADNYMLVVAGQTAQSKTGCVEVSLVRPFNLNTAEFEDEYHPNKQGKYQVPEAVQEKTGMDATGAGGKVADMDDDLKTLVTTPYTKKVENHWPFEALAVDGESSGDDSSSSDSSEGEGSSGLPSYVPPLLGAILGVLVVGCILALVLYYLRRRRRNLRRLQSDSAASTVVKKRQTWSWLMNTREGGEKGSLHEYDPTPNTEPGDPFDTTASYGHMSPDIERQNPLNEVPENQIYEMAGSNSAQELPAARAGKSVTINDEVQEIGHNEPISPLTPRPSVNKGALRDPTKDNAGASGS